MKNEKGITLVALVVVIVVMLVIASISISMLVNRETKNSNPTVIQKTVGYDDGIESKTSNNN